MIVTVYLPQNMSALRDEIALLHAEAAAKQVERLACPLEQKREVLRAVEEAAIRRTNDALDKLVPPSYNCSIQSIDLEASHAEKSLGNHRHSK